MADIRESFPSLEDATGAGVALGAVQSGSAPGTKNGSLAFGFRDSNGNVVLPQLDSAGKLPVSQDAPGTCLRGRAVLASGSQTVGTATTALTIPLVVNESYARICITASCFRNGVVQLVHNDDGTEEVLWDGLVGSGLFTIDAFHECLEFDTGATGTQSLLVKFTPTDKASDFRTTVSLLQKA